MRRGEQAKKCEARYVHGTLRCISDRHKREGECVIPGEIWCSAFELATSRGVAMGHQKSAEAIVGSNAEGPNMECRE